MVLLAVLPWLFKIGYTMKYDLYGRFFVGVGIALNLFSVHADTGRLGVTTTVIGVCKFTAGPYEIPFRTLDPSSIVDAIASTRVAYQCTNGTMATSVLIGTGGTNGSNTVTMANGAHTLPVHLTWSTPIDQGQGFGLKPVIAFTVNGVIAAADLQNAYAGQYYSSYNMVLSP